MNDNNRNSIPMMEILLTQGDAVNTDLLVSPLKRDLGTKADIEDSNFRFRIGRRPLVYNLRNLYQASGRSLPNSLEIFISYDIWLLTHAVSIIKERGFKKVQQFGYQVCFPKDPKVTVIDVLPQTQFITKIGTSFKSETDIKINGQAAITNDLINLLEKVIPLSFGGKLTCSNHANIVARLSFSTISSVVQAAGVGDNESEWIFIKDEKPLLGDQIMTQIILTPKYLERFNFKARIFATISTFNFLPVRLKSKWVKLECNLKN